MSGGGKTQTSTSTTTTPPEVMARYNAVNTRAENVASTPFQAYSNNASDFVAQLTPAQREAMSQAQHAATMAQPWFNAAGGATTSGMGAANLGDLDANKYLNPYTNYVVQNTADILGQQNQQAMSGALGSAIGSGAGWGDRSGIAAANLARQQQMGMGNVIGNLYSQGYSQALNTAQQQQSADLAARQANLARLLQGGAQLGQLGAGAQGAAIAGSQNLMNMGTQEQQTEQAGKSALYNQYQQARAYPFQVAQFLANIAMGTGALSGATTTETKPAGFFSGFKKGGKVIDGTYRRGGLAPESMGGHVGAEHLGEGYADGGAPADYSTMVMQQLFGGMDPGAGAYGGNKIGLGAGSYVPQANMPVGQLNAPKISNAGKQTGISDLVNVAEKGSDLWDKYAPKDDKSAFNVNNRDPYSTGTYARGGLAGGGMPYDPKNTGYVPDNTPNQPPELKAPEISDGGGNDDLSKIADMAKLAMKFMARGGAADGYEVQKGDTLWDIAKKHGMSLDDLIKANADIKDPNRINIGQRINLPQAAPVAPMSRDMRPGLVPAATGDVSSFAPKQGGAVLPPDYQFPTAGFVPERSLGNYASRPDQEHLANMLQLEAMGRRPEAQEGNLYRGGYGDGLFLGSNYPSDYNPGYASGGVAGRHGYDDGGFASDDALAELARKRQLELDQMNRAPAPNNSWAITQELKNSDWGQGLAAARNNADLEAARRAALMRSEGAGMSTAPQTREFPRQSTQTGLVPALPYTPGGQNLPPQTSAGLSTGDVTAYGRPQDRPVAITTPTTNARSLNQYVPEEAKTGPRTLREMFPMIDAQTAVFGAPKSEMSPAEVVGRPLIDIAGNIFPFAAGLAGQGYDFLTKTPSEYNALYNAPEAPTAKLHPGLSAAAVTPAAAPTAAPTSTTTGTFRELAMPAGTPTAGYEPGLGKSMLDLGTATPVSGTPTTAITKKPFSGSVNDLWSNIKMQESGNRQFREDGSLITGDNGRSIGISQIQDASAKEAADYLGIPYDPARLRSDPAYNETLGHGLLDKLYKKYGSAELAAAAYNAGQGRVDEAIAKSKETGRPWQEFIPNSTVGYIANVTGGAKVGTTGGVSTGTAGLGGNDIAAGRTQVANAPQGGLANANVSAPTTTDGATSAGGGGGDGKGFDWGSLLLPALAGIGKMAGSQSRYLGTALLEGIGGGAEAYMNRQKQLADIASTKAGAVNYLSQAMRNMLVDDGKGNLFVPLKGGGYQPLYTYISDPNRQPTIFGDTVDRILGDVGKGDLSSVGLIQKFAQQAQQGVIPTQAEAPANILWDENAERALENAKRSFGSNILTGGNLESSGAMLRSALGAGEAAGDAKLTMLPQAGEVVSAIADKNSGRLNSFVNENVYGPLANILKQLGIEFPWGEDRTTQMDILNKNAAMIAGKAAQNGDQRAAAALDVFLKMAPGVDLPPEANAEIMSTLLQSNQAAIDKANFYSYWQTRNNGLLTGADTAFREIYGDRLQQEHAQLKKFFQMAETDPRIGYVMDAIKNGGADGKPASFSDVQTMLREVLGDNISPALARYLMAGA